MFNYSPVEWIQNSTSTSSSIELNYYPSSATKIEVDAAFLTTRNSGYIFGIYTNNTARAFWATIDTSQLYFGSGNTANGYNRVYSYKNYLDNVKRTYRFELGKILVDGVEVATATNTLKFNSYGYKLNWFAGSIGYVTQIIQQVSEIRIYEEIDGVDTLIQRYIPVIRWSDRVIGFLEEHSNYFYKAPSDYIKGAALSEYTNNLDLRVGFKPEETVHYYISEDSKNFKLIDSTFKTIKDKDTALTTLFSNIDQRLLNDKNEKDAIWRLVNNKLEQVDNKNIVLNTLITKLSTDYSKEQLDALIASNDDLKATIDKLCDEIMQDHYTKTEVDDLVSKGSGSKMENYYTKAEIDEKIPEAEDLSQIQQFLENMTYYYNNLKLFTALNGKGE